MEKFLVLIQNLAKILQFFQFWKKFLEYFWKPKLTENKMNCFLQEFGLR